MLRRLLPVLLLPATFTVTGCSLGATGADEATGDRDGQEVADQEIHAQAESLADDLAEVAWTGRLEYLEVQVPPESQPYGGSRLRRQLLLAEPADTGTPGFELVVRIRYHYVPQNTEDWSSPGEATVARCFRYVVTRDADVVPDETDCPDGDPIRIDTDVQVPEPPRVRPRDRDAIRHFLRRGGTAADVDVLDAALGRGLTPVAEDADGTTAVAVTARPDGSDCVVGRRRPDGRVQVWFPDRVMTLPGELGCSPTIALEYDPGYVAGA